MICSLSSHLYFATASRMEFSFTLHYCDVIMGAVASQITSLTIVYSTVYSDADQRKHQSSASQAFVPGIHRRPVNSSQKWPVTRRMFPFDDVIICKVRRLLSHIIDEIYDLAPHLREFTAWTNKSPLGFNTLRARQNGRHFPNDIFEHIFLDENVWILIKISLKFVPYGPTYNNPALVQIMALCRLDDKPLCEPMIT